MESNIARLIKLKTQPIAVIKSSELPENAVQFREGVWNCCVAMLKVAAKGKTAALSERTTGCQGGKAGTGFKPYELGVLEYFLSTGEKGAQAGEFYKKSPELAKEFLTAVPITEPKKYLLLQPLDAVRETDEIQSVIFLVNADQLSALVTLANYDKPTQDNVQVRFGSGCTQSILTAMCDEEKGSDVCTIGLTDPSARKVMDKELLSFSIPYHRFAVMEGNAEESFLTKETWQNICKRIVD